MPLTSWPAASRASPRQCNLVPVLLFLQVILQQAWVHNGVYQFSTKSRRMREDEGRPGKKTADKLGRILVRNTQPMPLTSWRAASCASLRQVPDGEYQFSTPQNRNACAKMKASRGKKQQVSSVVQWYNGT